MNDLKYTTIRAEDVPKLKRLAAQTRLRLCDVVSDALSALEEKLRKTKPKKP